MAPMPSAAVKFASSQWKSVTSRPHYTMNEDGISVLVEAKPAHLMTTNAENITQITAAPIQKSERQKTNNLINLRSTNQKSKHQRKGHGVMVQKGNLPDLREKIQSLQNKRALITAGKQTLNIDRQKTSNAKSIQQANTNGLSRPKFQQQRDIKANQSTVNKNNDALYSHRALHYKKQQQQEQFKTTSKNKKCDGRNANRIGVSVLLRGDDYLEMRQESISIQSRQNIRVLPADRGKQTLNIDCQKTSEAKSIQTDSANTDSLSRPKFRSDDAFYLYRSSYYKSKPIKAPIEKQRQHVKKTRKDKRFHGQNTNRIGVSVLLRGDDEQEIHPESIPLPQDEEDDADDIVLSKLMASLSLCDGQ